MKKREQMHEPLVRKPLWFDEQQETVPKCSDSHGGTVRSVRGLA